MKGLNYSVNHNDWNLEGIKDLKSSTKIAAVLMYSCVKHFTKSKQGYYDLYQNNWANDLGITEHTIRKAIKELLKFGHITKIRDYQRKGNIPARYVTRGQKVYNQRSKGMAPGATVNNYVNNYKQDNDGFNKPHHLYSSQTGKNPYNIDTQPAEWSKWETLNKNQI